MKALRIIILDTHNEVGHSLAFRLSHIPGLNVVANAADTDEALQQIETLRPDLIILNTRMPEDSGLETCRRLAKEAPRGVRVAVLTSFGDVSEVQKSLHAGACGYLLKDLDIKVLASQIRELAHSPLRRRSVPKRASVLLHYGSGHKSRQGN